MIKRTTPAPPDPFTPVPVRTRADGWTPERQAGFIAALAQTASVEAAARAVEMGTSSAYALRARPDARAFRDAWRIALDYAVHQLGEAVLDRALHGTATPVFYKGEQIGERRRYDERLAMFVLRMRDPERFGHWREGRMPIPAGDAPGLRLALATARLGMGPAAGDGPSSTLLGEPRLLSQAEEEEFIVTRAQEEVDAARRAGWRPRDDDEDDFPDPYRDDADYLDALDYRNGGGDRRGGDGAEPDEQGGT